MPEATEMESEGSIGSQGPKKDRTYAQQPRPTSQTQPAPLVNGTPNDGPNSVLPNGVSETHHAPPTTNGASEQTNIVMADSSNPPSLDQSWRQGESNKSLGSMIERVAQKCYSDLSQTLTQMSEIEVEPQQQQRQPNGIVSHASEDRSEGSLKKKRLLMDFASNQRDLFIKTLVLSDSCRNEADMSKVIDITVWQKKERQAQFGATNAIAQIKENMVAAKVPAPNIEGAMELLANGKASWVPDLAYIPPKRLTARQMLKTLRNMNVILATRLNVHDDLPHHFSDYSIADGRVTFVVRDEFEVDLSVADEDPATPFYFIDIRLLFKPASNVLNDRLQGFLEAKVNQELAANGLKACYDFLHNFVITHKINVLRSQATELIRGKWFECIRPENMRRSLIVRYWAGMPGPKSWLEIGVSSGKKEAAHVRRAAVPQLLVRWFRKGSEVSEEPLEFDWRDLSLEEFLVTVIRKHVKWTLRDLRDRIRKLTGPDSVITVDVENVGDSLALVLNRPSMKQSLLVKVDPVTGQLSISPASGAASHTERRMNTEASIDIAKNLVSLTSVLVQNRVHREAELLGWSNTPNMTRQDSLQTLFGEGTRHLSVFTPSSIWGNRWALVVTFTSGGEKWWVVSLEEKLDAHSNTIGKVFATAREVLQLDLARIDEAVSKATLIRIERLAVAEVAFGALTAQLKNMGVHFTLERPTLSASIGKADAALVLPTPTTAMFIRFTALMESSSNNTSTPWASEMIRITHQGIAMDAEQSGNVRHDLRLTLEHGRMSHLRKYLSEHEDRDLAINSTEGLALRFLSPFGEPFVEQIQKLLRSVERLDRWIAVLKANGFKCTHASLSKISFTYHESPKLDLQLSFSDVGSLPIRLKLDPPEENPHQRIRVMLEQNVNNTSEKTFETFAPMLAFTLPVLSTIQRLESAHPAKQSFVLHPRASTWYMLKYLTPFPECVFQIRVRKRIDGGKKLMQWFVEPTNNNDLPQDLMKALKELWQSNGEHWEGLGTGIAAGAQGISTALEKIDETVRQFEMSAEELSKSDASAKDTPAEALKSDNAVSQPAAADSTPQTTTTAPKKPPPDVIMLD